MRYSPLVGRIGGPGARAWDIHTDALARRRAGDEVILLSVGDPDFATPGPVVERAVEALRGGRTHYGPIRGEPALRRAIAARHERLTGCPADPERIVVTAGAQNGLFAAALCLLAPGDEVVVPEPMYVTYEAVLGAAGAEAVTVPLRPGRGFRPDPGDLAAAVSERTAAIWLNSPHNPTGAMLGPEDLQAVAALCRRHDLWCLSDEVYAGLAFDAPHASPAALDGMAGRTVVVSSLSKTHAMTGWRLGWVVSPSAALAGHLHDLLLCMLYGSPGFVQDAGVAALEAGLEEPEAMRRAYRARRDLVCEALGAVPGLACHRPDGGMFVMLDVRGTGLAAGDFARGLLDGHGVSVLPAEAFGPSAAGHVRVSLCAPEAELAEGCRRIAAYAGAAARSATA